MTRLLPKEIADIRRRFEAEPGEPLAELAREYGIDYNHAYKLVSYDAANSAAVASQRRLREWRRDADAEMERYGKVSEPLYFGVPPEPPPPSLTDKAVALKSEGLSTKEIAEKLNKPYHTVWDALKRSKKPQPPTPPTEEQEPNA